MSKNLSSKYYQENKERLQKTAWERYQSLSKEEKKSVNMVASDTNISQKMKKKLVEYRKKYYKMIKNALL